MYVELVVASEYVPAAELGQMLRVGTATESIGTQVRRGPGRVEIAASSVWVVPSGLTPDSSVSEHLTALLRATDPGLGRLRARASDVRPEVVLRVIQYIDPSESQGHGFVISSDWLAVLAHFDSSVDVDQYVDERLAGGIYSEGDA